MPGEGSCFYLLLWCEQCVGPGPAPRGWGCQHGAPKSDVPTLSGASGS